LAPTSWAKATGSLVTITDQFSDHTYLLRNIENGIILPKTGSKINSGVNRP
jgi:hypothetical protein